MGAYRHPVSGDAVVPLAHARTVVVQSRPFSTGSQHLTLPEGASLAEMVAVAGIDPALEPFVRVWIEDAEIYRGCWHVTRPREGRQVFIRVVPMGGGGGSGDRKNGLASILMLVVSIASAAFAGPLAGVLFPGLAAGSAQLAFATAAVGAGLSLVGALAVSALIPPPKQSGGLDSQREMLTGVRNRLAPYAPIPRIFGKRRVYPLQAARPYTEAVGDKRWIRVLLLVGWGPLAITNIKIGETPIGAFANIETEVREGWQSGHSAFGTMPGAADAPPTLFTQTVSEDSFSILLPDAGRDGGNIPIDTPGAWVTRTTLPACDEISIDVTAVNGLARYEANGSRKDLTLEVDVEYRLVGAGSWTSVNWDGNDEGDGTQTDGKLTLKDSSAAPVVRGGRWEVASGQYEVRLRRRTKDQNDRAADTLHWTALRSIIGEYPVAVPGVATIALKIKASDQFQSLPDTINCEAQSYLPILSGAVWAWGTSRSPAWAYADLLRRRGDVRQIADARIDTAAISAWATACATTAPNAAEPWWQFDGVLDRGSVFDGLRQIAAHARADYIQRDGLHSVVLDQLQATPVQHITPRNSWGYSGSKVFLDRPHALRIQYINADEGWQEDEVIVYDDGYTAANATRYETLEMPYSVSGTQCWRDGRYHIAVGKLRPEEHSVYMDIENLRCGKGDYVLLAHDVIAIGVASARIKSRVTVSTNTTGFVLDEAVPMRTGQAYALRARKADGTSVLYPLQGVGSDTTTSTVTLTTPIPTSTAAAPGDLVTFGESTRETAPMKVRRIEPGPDLSAKITLVDDQPGVYSAVTGTIPAFSTYVNNDTPVDQQSPEAPTIFVRSDEAAIERLNDGTLIERIVVGIAPARSSLVATGNVEVQWRQADTGPWSHAPGSPSPADKRVFPLSPVRTGDAYDVRARFVGQSGRPGEWSYALGHVVVGKSTPPETVSGFTATALPSAVRLTWLANPEIDIADYEIRRGASWATGTVVATGVPSLEYTAPGEGYDEVIFWIKARDTSGLMSASAAFDSATPDKIGGTDIDTGWLSDVFADVGDLIDSATAPIIGDIELIRPDQRTAEESIAVIGQLLIDVQDQIREANRRIAGAGIYIDPATGNVELYATKFAEEQANLLSLELDAVAGQISLRATTAYVDQAITNAVLDPSQIPLLDDINLRVNAVEITLDSVEAELVLKATSIDLTALGGRVTTAETDIDSLEASITTKVETTTFDSLETRVSTAETTLEAIDGASITRLVADSRAATEDAEGTANLTLADILNGWEQRNLARADLAVVREEISAEVTADRIATAQSLLQLGAEIDANQALVQQEIITRVSETTALALSSEQLAIRMGDAEGSIEQVAVVAGTANDTIAASYVIRVRAGSGGAEFEMVAGSTPEGAASMINFSADRVGFLSGMTHFGGVLQSTDFVTGTAGWQIDEDGNAEFNNLIDRSALTEDAVFDTWTTTEPGPFGNTGAATVVVATLNIGPIAQGSILFRALSFKGRDVSQIGQTNASLSVVLERRFKQLGGGWEAWEVVSTFTSFNLDSWRVRTDSSTIAGFYDDFEYRLSYSTSPASSAAGNVLESIMLVVKQIA